MRVSRLLPATKQRCPRFLELLLRFSRDRDFGFLGLSPAKICCLGRTNWERKNEVGAEGQGDPFACPIPFLVRSLSWWSAVFQNILKALFAFLVQSFVKLRYFLTRPLSFFF